VTNGSHVDDERHEDCVTDFNPILPPVTATVSQTGNKLIQIKYTRKGKKRIREERKKKVCASLTN
jgi:hypothetical protein